MHPNERAAGFCQRFGLQLPLLLAPMAGACPPAQSIAVANAGGMGAMGALVTWCAPLEDLEPEETAPARAFTGRLGRAVATRYVLAAAAPDAPPPAPYPVQRGLTNAMKEAGTAAGDHHRMQVWAGQSAAMARAVPAGDLVRQLWTDAAGLLRRGEGQILR